MRPRVGTQRGRIESAKSVGGSDVNDLDGESGKSKRFCNGRLPEPPQADNGGGERFAMIPEWAAGVKLLTKTAQRVDIALGSLCNARWGEERVVQASLSELASLTKIDRRHVARAIGELERAGRLQKRLRWLTELGSYDKTEYLLLDRPAGEREGSGKNLPLGNGKNLPLGSGKNLPLGNGKNKHQVLPELGARQAIEEERFLRSPKKVNAHDAFADPIKKVLFEAGLQLLVEHGGLRGDRARSILGRWRKLVGHKNDPVLLGWIRDAQRDSVSDPVASLEAVIKQHAKQSEFGAGYRPMPSAAGG
jgi:hypothetical protein